MCLNNWSRTAFSKIREKTDQEIAPEKTENSHTTGSADNCRGKGKEAVPGCASLVQHIYAMLDKARYDQLQQVNRNDSGNTNKQAFFVAEEQGCYNT